MSELHGAELIAAVRDVLHENGWCKNVFCDTSDLRVCVRGAALWATAGGLWGCEIEDADGTCSVDLELCAMLAPVIREQYRERIGSLPSERYIGIVAAFNDDAETTWD